MSIVFFSASRFPNFTGKGNAPCAETDPESFFPEPGRIDQNREAKKVCGSCAYKVECLEWALEGNEDGIWGGTTERERRALKRHRRYTKMKEASLASRPGYGSSEVRAAG